VLNRAPESPLRKRFSRWFNGAALLIALNLSVLHAADNPGWPTSTNQIEETNLAAAVVPPEPRADWQRHFTLGAGDVLNFSLYGEPTLTELNVPIGPDGRVSYLEAQDVMAAGLTIDELRSKLDEELAKYRRAPHSIITPVAFNSKKYFLLGSVMRAGAFQLDRPTTIVEAIARARGFETVVQDRDLVELADLPRAFLVRHGRRLPVDFEKLFLQGDLSQNIPLAPDDYLFIPPADLKQVFVVGEVLTPGATPYSANLSAVSAIADQGGFTPRAWQQKVLVIRGSLNHPQTFVVDVKDVLSASTPDFKLEPNDIVYVHYRPWAKAEDVLDLAATAFVQSAIITWTDIHAGPLITRPIIQ
ncbi:MAG TPA: polysaccharide biosynthesis/export family protein, partial [Verrucomicrobiae bacterium]|nr:polysaccharide biosynthesis/export family protein [Verrucomicrobiae bacterium]